MVFVTQKILPKNKFNEYKMTERKIYKKFDNLSEKELNRKIKKRLMSKMVLWLLLLNDVEEKKQEV